MAKQIQNRYYLSSFLRVVPLSHALWRTAEALAFHDQAFRQPILDIGCGFGEFAGVVFDRLIEVGIDINQSDLQKAIHVKKYKRLVWADARKLPFRRNTFSTVISVSVLEHIEGAETVVGEVHRVLKKGGLFIFSVPTDTLYKELFSARVLRHLGLGSAADWIVTKHRLAFKHVTVRPAGWWRQQLTKYGFEIVEEYGTVSSTLLTLHELFLPFAFPSQLWKALFGKRLMMSVGMRSALLTPLFSRFTTLDRGSSINMFYVAKKV